MAFRGRNGQASLRRLLKLLEPNLFGRGCPTLTVHMLHFHWPLTLPKTPLLNPALRRMSGTPLWHSLILTHFCSGKAIHHQTAQSLTTTTFSFQVVGRFI